MRPRIGSALVAAVLVLCWSSGFVGAVFGTREAPVDTVLMWRTLVSAVLLGGWAVARREPIAASGLARQALLGLLVQVTYLGGVFAAAGAGVPAGTSALVAALQPLLVAAAAGVLLRERTSGRQRVGLVVGAVGAAVVVAGDLGGGHAAPWAYLLPVGALFGLGIGTLLDRHWQTQESVVVSLAAQSAIACVVFSAIAATHGDAAPPATGGFVGAITWLVLLSTAGGYGTYLLVVRRSGATRASTLLYLTPPATAIWAWLLFDQTPGATTYPGMAISAVGVALALTQGHAPTPPSHNRDTRNKSVSLTTAQTGLDNQ